MLRYLDLPLLAIALPVFLVGDLPIAGYVVCAGVWLVTRLIQHVAMRYAARALARGERRPALGLHAGTILARVWMLALAILLVGLSDRAAGLAAAVLAAGLVTAYLAGTALARLFEPEGERR